MMSHDEISCFLHDFIVLKSKRPLRWPKSNGGEVRMRMRRTHAFILALAILVLPIAVATPARAALPDMSLCSAGTPTVPCVQQISVVHSGTTTDVFTHSSNTWGEVWPGSGMWTMYSSVHSGNFVTGDTINATFDMGPKSDPATYQYYSMYTAGDGQAFTIDTSGSDVIVSYSVVAADMSWMTDGNVCNVIACADNLVADYDSTAMITQIMPIDGVGKPLGYSGSWMSSNAQSTRLFWEADEFGFQAASPHFKHSPSSAIANGFFKMFLPRNTLTSVFSAPDITASTFADLMRFGDTVGGVGTNLTGSATITDVDSGILISYPNMHYSAHDLTLTRAIVTWAPTNASVTGSSGSISPSSAATTNGDGAITYAVASPGSTGCSVDSSSGLITYGAAGSCRVTALSSATAKYASASKDVTFVISAPAPLGGAPSSGTGNPPTSTQSATPTVTPAPSSTPTMAPGPTPAPTMLVVGNPTVGFRPAGSISVLSQSSANRLAPTRVVLPPGGSLRAAPHVEATLNRPISLRLNGLNPSQALNFRIKVGQRYVSLPNTWVNQNGFTTLPAFTIARSGSYVVALIEPQTGATRYLKIRVSGT